MESFMTGLIAITRRVGSSCNTYNSCDSNHICFHEIKKKMIKVYTRGDQEFPGKVIFDCIAFIDCNENS